MIKTQTELVLDYFKQLRDDAGEYARFKTGEAGMATRRAADLEAFCAELEAEIRETKERKRNGKTRD